MTGAKNNNLQWIPDKRAQRARPRRWGPTDSISSPIEITRKQNKPDKYKGTRTGLSHRLAALPYFKQQESAICDSPAAGAQGYRIWRTRAANSHLSPLAGR